MPDTQRPTRLGLHPAAVIGTCVVTTLAGAALGLGADALVGWLESTFDDAPALLRAAAALPVWITRVGLTVAGLVVGVLVVAAWEEQTLVCEIGSDGVRTRLGKHTAWVAREQIGAVLLDGEELVLAGRDSRTLAVGKVDGVGSRRLADTFREAGYPWLDGGYPASVVFRPFIEGRDDLGERGNRLIQDRAVALEDGRTAAARRLRVELSAAGVLVRDRRDRQEYALLGEVDRAG